MVLKSCNQRLAGGRKQSPEQDTAARSSQGGNKSVLEFKTVHPLQKYPRKDEQRCQLLGSLAPKGRHRKNRYLSENELP